MLVLSRTVGQEVTIDLTELLAAHAAGLPVDPTITICLPKNQAAVRVRLGITADQRASIQRDDINVKSARAPLLEFLPKSAADRTRGNSQYAGTTS